jgi:hypothetical protein
MATDELVRNDDMGPALERPIGAEAIRQLVQARCPELSLCDLEAAFCDAHTDDVLVEIANAVTDAVEVLEARLDALDQRIVYPGGLQ